ncbi:hypothetical protein TKK_0010923 [Trichogramma kaykai]|uniref:Disease resistance R13L4/SHOC-2-like LRR domain-containing protein n=1 Tax=Trichogramma kaykai TaxID=54128 RepID=A0ABD2WV29_9HYME
MGNSNLKPRFEVAERTNTINLSGCKLNEFPPQLIRLAELLRSLDISNNGFSKIPEEIAKFKLLKHFDVSGNKLTYLNESIGMLEKLETLNASSNRINHLYPTLSNLTNLKKVDLSHNQLGKFPMMLCGLKHLDVLDLSHNRLTDVPKGVNLLHVTELNLNQNQIAEVSEDLADCPRLKTLRLEENCLPLKGIPKRILTDSKISMLALEGNLFEMKLFPDVEGYEQYMERYTAVKKKMF